MSCITINFAGQKDFAANPIEGPGPVLRLEEEVQQMIQNGHFVFLPNPAKDLEEVMQTTMELLAGFVLSQPAILGLINYEAQVLNITKFKALLERAENPEFKGCKLFILNKDNFKIGFVQIYNRRELSWINLSGNRMRSFDEGSILYYSRYFNELTDLVFMGMKLTLQEGKTQIYLKYQDTCTDQWAGVCVTEADFPTWFGRVGRSMGKEIARNIIARNIAEDGTNQPDVIKSDVQDEGWSKLIMRPPVQISSNKPTTLLSVRIGTEEGLQYIYFYRTTLEPYRTTLEPNLFGLFNVNHFSITKMRFLAKD